MALEPRTRNAGTGRTAFRLGGSLSDPSSFDLQFVSNSKLYRFGFRVDDQRIIEEWLVRVVGGCDKVIYERVTDASGAVTIDATGLEGAGTKVQALATVGGLQNQSFLATINATMEVPDVGEDLNDVLRWLGQSLILIAPNTSMTAPASWLGGNADLRKFAGDFLRSSSTGVDHLEISRSEISEEELRALFTAAELTSLAERTQRRGTAGIVATDGTEILCVQNGDRTSSYRVSVQAAHEHQSGQSIALELSEESDGTQRLLHLMPALFFSSTGNPVFVIDEIDRSLHPILVKHFLEAFLKSCTGGSRQLIFTTHESNLLDQDLLRRDEIWFAEKDERSATRLYSLMDFEVRKDPEIRKHYLQGRFGAIPFFGNLDELQVPGDQPG